jgi:hypothetical protein
MESGTRGNLFLLVTIVGKLVILGQIEDSSSDKYVPPHRRDISQRGKDFVICENANLKIVEPLKKPFSKRSQPTYYHCGVS